MFTTFSNSPNSVIVICLIQGVWSFQEIFDTVSGRIEYFRAITIIWQFSHIASIQCQFNLRSQDVSLIHSGPVLFSNTACLRQEDESCLDSEVRVGEICQSNGSKSSFWDGIRWILQISGKVSASNNASHSSEEHSEYLHEA